MYTSTYLHGVDIGTASSVCLSVLWCCWKGHLSGRNSCCSSFQRFPWELWGRDL